MTFHIARPGEESSTLAHELAQKMLHRSDNGKRPLNSLREM